jgi:hypothetical protein
MTARSGCSATAAFFVHLAAAATNLSWLEEFPLIEPL